MSIERCKNCSVIITQRSDGSWMHRISTDRGTQHACNHGEPGMGLHEMILEYWSKPLHYATWANLLDINALEVRPNPDYSPNCVLDALRFQATIHWNNCGNLCEGRCTDAAKMQAKMYMEQCNNGRHDLHPDEDQEVNSLAFEIHNEAVEVGNHYPLRAKQGVMTCTYVVGPGSSEACNCYERAYVRWIQEKQQLAERRVIAATVVDPEDAWWQPRYI